MTPKNDPISSQDLARERTDWAYERTQMASTRTFFALLRTGLAIAGGGPVPLDVKDFPPNHSSLSVQVKGKPFKNQNARITSILKVLTTHPNRVFTRR